MNKKEELKKKLVDILGAKFAKSKDITLLSEKFDKVLDNLDKRISQQIIRQFNIPSEVIFNGLKEELESVIGENNKGAIKALKDLSVEIAKTWTKKPGWYKEFDGVVEVKKLPAVKIEGEVKIEKQDLQPVMDIVSTALTAIFGFFGGLAKKVLNVKLPQSHYTTPQLVVLLDPMTMKPVDMKDVGAGTFKQVVNQYGGGSRVSSVGIRGSTGIGDNTATVTTAGTRVQLPNVACSRVQIQAHPNNAGDIVVGGSAVIAASGTRRGLALFGSQWAEFKVTNLNLLYIDATSNGDKINYIYEE